MQVRPNGCGTREFQFQPHYNLTECCNLHDRCYGTHGTVKLECDHSFLDCMLYECRGSFAEGDRHLDRCEKSARWVLTENTTSRAWN
jgi:hypothetical protein